MRRRDTHPSILLAWALANAEACLAGSPQIDPIHFLSALLQILDDAYHQMAERIGLSPEEIGEVAVLAAEGREIIGMPQEQITRLRRTIQKTRAPLPPEEPQRALHRSAQARGAFDLAGGYALEERAAAFTMLHLLRALLVYSSPDLTDVLPRGQESKPELTWETRVIRFAEQFQLGRIIILMSDIEGSMALKRRLGDLESAKLFRTHANVFRDELAATPDAREIQSMGDAFLLVFTSPGAAVHFALRVQSRLRTHPQLAQCSIRVRMGICSGEILSKVVPGSNLSEPIFGITIDTTSRVCSLAVGDQILTDRSIHDTGAEAIRAAPPAGLGPVEWRSHGEYHLKGLEAPVEIFEVGESGKAAFVHPRGSEKAAPALLVTDADPGPPVSLPGRRHSPTIEMFGRDLTAQARMARLAPVVGRAREIKQLARYLQRTSKRNVLVIGDAGVGKTAVVEGLAQRAASPDAPPFLRDLRLVQVSVADLIAGAKHRGDMEERIQGILREASSDPNLVLFFDEVHLMMKTGAGGDAPLDLANLLKPALARDDFRCIGATTTEEFDRHVKNDAAFLRRFQVLRVPEPTGPEALEICRAWARRIEKIQNVAFAEEALEAAVQLSTQLIRGRSLPDKAIDLLENTAAFVKVSSLSTHSAVPTKHALEIGRPQIEQVLEEHYGISSAAAKVLDPQLVRTTLEKSIVGQSDAITSLVTALSLCARRDRTDSPLAVFLFTGPTGVGKTFAAECIAEALFGTGTGSLCRFNMSEFKERHELARLVGAPPGFVGHEQIGALFRHLESHGRGLILLDEMDKAHPEIQDYFLQVFDKGEAMDSRGRMADFRRYVIVMTCNLAAASAGGPPIGFRPVGHETRRRSSRAAPGDLSQHFRAEFLARIDRVVPFQALGEREFKVLLDRRIAAFALDTARHHQVRLELTDGARSRLTRLVLDRQEGVRGFDRVFEEFLVARVLEYCEKGPKKPVLRVSSEGDKLICSWAE